MGNTVRMVSPDGGPAVEVPAEDAQVFADRGYLAQTNDQRAATAVEGAREDYYSSPQAKVAAGLLAGARTVTGGLSDAAIRAFGSDGDRADTAALRDYNHGLSTAVEIGGSLLPGGAGALASDAGKLAGGSSVLGAARGAAVEGGIIGGQQGVSEIALSDDPISIERAASVLGSNVLFGAATGGAIGATGKLAEKGLLAAKSKLDKFAARGIETSAEIGDDLTKLDRKGLRAAEKTETDAIEAARVPKRAEVAQDLAAFRKEMKDQKVWLATKGVEDAELKSAGIGKRTLDADRALDKLLRDPKALAESPQAALKQLRVQESALDDLVNVHGPRLRETVFAADKTGTRVAALDNAAVALEKNRALQTKIGELTGKATSPRLEAIQDAVSGLGAATKRDGATVSDVLGQAAMGHAVGALAGVPYLGQAVLAAKAVGGIMKKLGADTTAAAARGSQAIGMFLDVSRKVAPKARLAATKTLTSVAYGDTPTEQPSGRRTALPDAYKARSAEIRNLTEPGPDGKSVMRMDARQKMGERLAPIRAANPLLADRIESNRARSVEFLADKMPRKPDLPGMDKWQPSDMEMRTWARHVAAVEDPHGVIERLASGEVTPEDAETIRECYPEMFAKVQAEIMMQMGELRARLPYQRRLALSIFSGVPVDPTLDPRVLSALQAGYAAEAGTEGGVQAPRAQPAFGSVSKEKPTAAQERGA